MQTAGAAVWRFAGVCVDLPMSDTNGIPIPCFSFALTNQVGFTVMLGWHGSRVWCSNCEKACETRVPDHWWVAGVPESRIVPLARR